MSEQPEETAASVVKEFHNDLKRSSVLSGTFVSDTINTMWHAVRLAREEGVREGMKRTKENK